MAKPKTPKKVKPEKFIDYLDYLISAKEKIIIERNGLVPLDFENLSRYLKVRSYYKQEVIK